MQSLKLSWPVYLACCVTILTWPGTTEAANIKRVRRQTAVYNSVSCPEPFGQFEFQGQCSRYIQCDNNVPSVEDCQTNLVFNPARGYCDFPANVPSCQPAQRGITSSPGQEISYDICSSSPNGGDEVNGFHVAHPEICNAFYTCSSNYLYAPCTFCPEHMYFSLPERRCRHNATGDFATVCQGREFVAHADKVFRQLDGTCRATGGNPAYDRSTSRGNYQVLGVPYVATNAVLHPAVNTVIHPLANTVLHPAVNTVLHPAVNTVLHPAVNTVLHPAVNTVVQPGRVLYLGRK